MDAYRILIFREVARCGSMSRAAAALGWTQPAVGQHIQRLERDVGLPLVLRSPRGITLTEAGAILLTHAEALAARLATAEAELAALAELQGGSVRLAAFPSAAAVLVPPALRSVAARAPALDVRLTELEPPEAQARVLGGDMDLAVVFEHGPEFAMNADLATIDLCVDPVKAVVPSGHRLAGRTRPIAVTELRDDPWIAGCPRCEENLVRMTAAAGFAADIRHRTDDYVVVQRLVAEGLAVTLLPQLALTAAPNPDVVALPVQTQPRRRIALILRRELIANPAVALTIEALQIDVG